ncbi:MAG: fatty acyl-AMP ligase [Chloroflexi bacterium]|nr:MAG: fatty acyl-AMP ligase [Chloroflexota bacterium]
MGDRWRENSTKGNPQTISDRLETIHYMLRLGGQNTWRTLPELLAHNAEFYPDLLFARFLKRSEVVATCTYAQTLQKATDWAALFLEHGLQRGEAVVLALPNTEDFVYAYFGVLLAGGVPAATVPIRRLKADSHYLANIAQRLQSIHARTLILSEAQAGFADVPPLSSIEKLTVLTRRDVQTTSQYIAPSISKDDLGVLQFTSGTASQAKVVQLSNAALLAQMRNISARLKVVSHEDSGLSWLPFFHDMGLIGIKALSDFRATITCGPTSAYALCARFLKDSEVEHYDLRHLRAALVGAEMISQESLRQFIARLQPAGFRAASLLPAYGLAENGVAVTLTPVEEGPAFDAIDLETLQTKGFAQPVQSNGATSVHDALVPTRSIACTGTPLPETEVVIVNGEGERLGERQVGEVLVSSPSLMEGYYNQPEATHMVLRDGWLWTGDLGYLANGRLYITGRKKEVLIVGGRNYYPHDLEQVVTTALGMHRGDAVAIAYEDPGRATELVVILVETAATDHVEREALRQRVRQVLIDADYPVSEVVLLRPKTIQVTPNGKLKRVELKTRYLKGEFLNGNETS